MSKLNKFLILIIIVNVFASIFIMFSKTKTEEEKVFEIGNFNEFINTYKAGPSPERYRTFIQGIVENKFEKIYENTKNLTDVQLKNYYDENNTTNDMVSISTMESEYGISDYETLKNLVQKLRTINQKGAKYKKSSIVKKSCKMNSDYTTSELEISYSKSQKITMTVEMTNILQYDIQTFKISVKEDK